MYLGDVIPMHILQNWREISTLLPTSPCSKEIWQLWMEQTEAILEMDV